MNGRRTLKLGLVTGLVLSCLVPGPASGGRAKQNTPNDSIMVVSANLLEAWDYKDTLSHWDMDVFAQRVMDEFKFKPDVLALQEVRGSSAAYVAKALSRRSNQRYRVVVKPPANPYFPYGGGRAGAKETAIVINTKTMKVVHEGGYMATVAKASHEVEPHDPVYHQAYALLQKRNTNMKFATMSVHLLPPSYLASTSLDKYYREKWVKQMHSRLRNRYGSRKGVRFVMAGDFNMSSCARGEKGVCYRYSPFWKTLRSIGYEDTSKDNGPIDYIFSKGLPGAIHGQDSGYGSIPKARRYSDHSFRWSVLGPDRYDPVPPRPIELDLRRKPGGKPLVQVHWGKAHDRAGSGVVLFELTKKVNDGTWTTLPVTKDFAYYDDDVQWKDTVRYRMRVKDKAGNFSPYLRASVQVLGENVAKV